MSMEIMTLWCRRGDRSRLGDPIRRSASGEI